MSKVCVICGSHFSEPPSSKKVTCGPECSRERKSQSHQGKHNRWSAEARARKSAAGQAGGLTKGTVAARLSPIAGPFETNQNARVWRLLSPNNKAYTVRNLAKFTRDNPEFFPEPRKAADGIRQIQRYYQGKTKRVVSSYKGWQLITPNTK